jgi:RNA polymerase sigma factor (sigma-70 family)
LICGFGLHIGLDVLRATGSKVSIHGDGDSEVKTALLEGVGIKIDPAGNLNSQELRESLEKCVGQLPVKQRVIAELVWFRSIQASEVAHSLGISPPAVSQHVKKARESLRICLNSKGFELGVPRTEN